MEFGSWNVNVEIGSMPQKVASAMGELNEKIVGAEYTPIAYLGSQQVNGVNHAVLAEQLVISGKDSKNIVLIILNEKPGADKATVVNIERVAEGGDPLGGLAIDVKTDIPEEAEEAFKNTFVGYLGSSIKPFALLATKVTKGTNYLFAAVEEPVVLEPQKTIVLVMINSMTNQAKVADILTSRLSGALGYAFTW